MIYGLPWNHKIDIWSIACILFEYYTGKTMFQTHDNCEHLAMMDKTIGSPPNSFAKKCKHPFYTRVGTNYVLNWDENTEDGVYVKTNCKPLEVNYSEGSMNQSRTVQDSWLGCPRNGNFAIFPASSQQLGWYFWGSLIWSLLTIYLKISFQRAPTGWEKFTW